MRIIAGRLGGRNFASPFGYRTHPMSEKMRGAIFSALGDIAGLMVLDAFAGSGALAIEAVSRGAGSVVTIEADKRAHNTILKNVEALNISNIEPTKAFVGAWLTRHPDQRFDLILADPPYDDIPYKDLEKLPKHLSENGILVLSWPAGLRLPLFNDLQIVQHKEYGDSQLIYYQK